MISERFPDLAAWADRYLFPFDDAGSRLFGFNLAAAALLALAFLGWQSRKGGPRLSWESVRRTFFDRRYWWNRSTRTDYALYFLNSLIKIALLAPFVSLSFWVSARVLMLLTRNLGAPPSLAPSWPALLAFSAGAFVLDDFLRYFHHWLMHRVPVLWKLHQVHHSARVLTPVTLFRVHPIESAIATARNALSIGAALGAYLYYFDGSPNLTTLAGAGIFNIAFNFLGANLRHSHLPVSFGPLERLLISPAQHQLHHSRSPRPVNYGVSLALWDWIGGSLARSASFSHVSNGRFRV